MISFVQTPEKIGGLFGNAFKIERKEREEPEQKIAWILKIIKAISIAEETGKKEGKDACVTCPE